MNKALRSLAIVLVLSTQVLSAAPLFGSKKDQAPYGPASVAVVPFTFIGRVDADLTNAFLEQLASLNTGSKVVDGASLTSHLRKGVNFRSDASLPALLKAAKAAQAEVLITGQASSYKFMDAPGIKLRVKVYAVNTGKELHRSVAEETSFTLPGAKSEAGSTAAKKIAKQWKNE